MLINLLNVLCIKTQILKPNTSILKSVINPSIKTFLVDTRRLNFNIITAIVCSQRHGPRGNPPKPGRNSGLLYIQNYV
jgi:hypothetical protein